MIPAELVTYYLFPALVLYCNKVETQIIGVILLRVPKGLSVVNPIMLKSSSQGGGGGGGGGGGMSESCL